MSGREASDYFDRYSRQFYVLGERTMQSLGKASVLVSGLGGLGVEIGTCLMFAHFVQQSVSPLLVLTS